MNSKSKRNLDIVNSDNNNNSNNISHQEMPQNYYSQQQHDNITGQRLFEPVINKESERLALRNRNPTIPVEDHLLHKGAIIVLLLFFLTKYNKNYI